MSRIGLNRIATKTIDQLTSTLQHAVRVGRMNPVPIGNLSAQANVRTRGATVSFLVNSLEGVDSFVLLRNFSQDIGTAQIIAIWPRATLLSTPQAFPVRVNYADADQSIGGRIAYYWVKAIPASNKTQVNVFISGPQKFDASGWPSSITISADNAVNQSYTPTTQPLGAVTGGSANHATVNIASFQIQYPFGLVTYSSGSITPLLDNTKYYISCNDPTYKGGAQTYLATTLNPAITGNTATVFLGTITTPAFGGGGTSGGGGGSGPCFDPETKILTMRGYIPMEMIQVGDRVQTRKGWRNVKEVLVHEYDGPMREMPDGGLVTLEHRIRKGDYWVRADSIFSHEVLYRGPVYNLSIEGKTDEEHCYRLANGYIAHNQFK